MICTIYSHQSGFDAIKEIIISNFPEGNIVISKEEESDIIDLEIKDGISNSTQKIKILYRERAEPSYQIPEINDSALTANLKGLYGFVYSLPTVNEKVKNLFLQKIQTLNSEFTIIQEEGEIADLKTIIANIANELDAVLFVQPDVVISKSSGQHFLDKNLDLIIDTEGNCEIDELDVRINSVYFDADQNELSEDQQLRKEKNEKILEENAIKINRNLPCIESEEETTLRTPKEIAQRVSALAVVNLVAFNSISTEEATEYLQNYNLWDFTTENEKEFLVNPTDDKKANESWKCEGIWVLMWALNKIETLDFPDEFCDLENIDPDNYPVGQDKDPNIFIDSIVSIRSKSEILDANDLYYRFNWACVDERINGREIEGINPGIVYERQYALNWLINYMDQDWDSVSCDT
ncbi:hypothetical protein FLA105534_01478 [Flavobacterium bizetiae]|uniref:DUF4272 domain-containing protein n=1 Tax=Flavobacterium bizetiae TaxID=2704140 RepID=A0A6J4GCZ5_9FLAO|nr:DUF4272 domain-containing protein [Flavobacterium bizetiae]CAA9197103.1 hypothetical protein FLA105534_01478 [Flavobacterium bizetiae]CAD5341514.1 hypothetical protein FLA105535_01488 [Flavobacterium bizetiae]CAD5347981.1 hypothetical protein FLA105534_01940 [Flavobacterium bizetiae]